ncbi:Uncharacterised protein [Bordetella pertussis]|nr:Uncharacterised protein [Bordetella pertussis]
MAYSARSLWYCATSAWAAGVVLALACGSSTGGRGTGGAVGSGAPA